MRRLAVVAAVVTVAAIAVVTAAGVWLMRTAQGLDWTVEKLTSASNGRLVIEAPHGSLGGEASFERIRWADGNWQVEAAAVRLRVAWLSLLAGTLRFDTPRVEQLTLTHESRDDGSPPGDLGLPFRLVLDRARIERARIDVAPRATDLHDLEFSYTGGPGEHRLHGARASADNWELSLAGTMAAQAPFEIRADGRLSIAGASLDAQATVHPVDDAPIVSLRARAIGVDLSRFAPSLPRTAAELTVDGRSASAARLAGRISAANALAGPLDSGRLPVSRVNAEFSFDGTSIALASIDAQALGGAVGGAGTLRWPFAGQVDLRLRGADLRQLRSDFRETSLAGSVVATFDGDTLSARAVLEQDGMRLSADAVRRGDRIDVRGFRFEAQGGSASGHGEVSLGSSHGVRGEVRFSNFDPSRFGRYPAASLSGLAKIDGRVQAPRALEAAWRIEASTLLGRSFGSSGSGRLEAERVRNVDAEVRWGDATLRARGALGAQDDRMAWQLASGSMPIPGISGAVRASGHASGAWRAPKIAFDATITNARFADRVEFARIDAHGEGGIEAHALRLVAQGRESRVSASLRGGWSRNRWKGAVDTLVNEGRYPLKLASPVSVSAEAGAVSIGAMRAALGEGRLDVDSFEWSRSRLSTAGRVSGLPAAWLIALAGAGEQVRTTLLLDGDWLLQSTAGAGRSFKDDLNGSVRLRRSGGDVTLLSPTARDLGLRDAALEALLDRGALRASLEARSTLGDIEARGRADALDPAARFVFDASMRLADLRVLTGPLPENVRVGGRLTAQVSGRGTLDAPEFAGRLSANALQVQLPPYGVYLDDGTMEATLAGDRLRIDALDLRGGQGRLTATGFVPLNARAGEASLAWEARELQALGRPDLRLVVSGRGRAMLRERRVAIEGAVSVDQGTIERELRALPRLDDDIVVRGREARDRPRDRIPVNLDIDLDLGKRLTVRQGGFDGRLEGRVRVVANGDGELRAQGRVVAANATFRAYGQALAVDPGVLVFAGPLRNPTLQIDAWRRNQAVAAGVRITGSLQAPRVELISDPPVPENEKLSWLVLGQAPGNASGADLALLQTAAGALLGRGRESVPVTRRIADALGLDEVALRGSSDLAGRVVALGKRLTDRLYVSYEQGVGGLAQTLIKLDLQLTSRWSLRAQAGSSSGAGVFYRYAWD